MDKLILATLGIIFGTAAEAICACGSEVLKSTGSLPVAILEMAARLAFLITEVRGSVPLFLEQPGNPIWGLLRPRRLEHPPGHPAPPRSVSQRTYVESNRGWHLATCPGGAQRIYGFQRICRSELGRNGYIYAQRTAQRHRVRQPLCGVAQIPHTGIHIYIDIYQLPSLL